MQQAPLKGYWEEEDVGVPNPGLHDAKLARGRVADLKLWDKRLEADEEKRKAEAATLAQLNELAAEKNLSDTLQLAAVLKFAERIASSLADQEQTICVDEVPQSRQLFGAARLLVRQTNTYQGVFGSQTLPQQVPFKLVVDGLLQTWSNLTSITNAVSNILGVKPQRAGVSMEVVLMRQTAQELLNQVMRLQKKCMDRAAAAQQA